MKKKTLIIIFALAILLISTGVVFAGAKNTEVYLEWEWPVDHHKSGYFQTTGSGLVHGWSYDRPVGPDMHYIYKPLEKVPDASCDAGWTARHETWKPQYLFNVLDDGFEADFMMIFPELGDYYYMCGYPIE